MKADQIIETEERIAKIFGVSDPNQLPMVTSKSLCIYLDYLKKNLNFPIEVEYSKDNDFSENIPFKKKIVGFPKQPKEIEQFDENYGLFCEIRVGRAKSIVPLSVLEIKEKSQNKQLIEDYLDWFWNNR